MSVDDDSLHAPFRSAASKAVMRSGRHFARFTVLHCDENAFGVIRPGWDVEEEEDAFDEDGHCLYCTGSGDRLLGQRNWEGQ